MALALRDPITGSPLIEGTLRLHVNPGVRLDNPQAVLVFGDTPEITARPGRLHTTQVEEGGLGGHCFSRDFARYLARVKPRLVTGWEKALRFWWASSYGRQRIEARFIERYGFEVGTERYHMALWLDSGFRPYEDVAAESGHSSYWLATHCVYQARSFAGANKARSVRPIEARRDR